MWAGTTAVRYQHGAGGRGYRGAGFGGQVPAGGHGGQDEGGLGESELLPDAPGGAGLPAAVDELADLTAPVRHGPVAEVLDSTFWVGPGLRDEFVSDAHDVGMAQAGHSVAKDG